VSKFSDPKDFRNYQFSWIMIRIPDRDLAIENFFTFPDNPSELKSQIHIHYVIKFFKFYKISTNDSSFMQAPSENK